MDLECRQPIGGRGVLIRGLVAEKAEHRPKTGGGGGKGVGVILRRNLRNLSDLRYIIVRKACEGSLQNPMQGTPRPPLATLPSRFPRFVSEAH